MINGKHFIGTYRPVNVMRNGIKLAGWNPDVKSGESINYEGTYNDTAEVVIEGNTVQISDYYKKDGLLTQDGTPTPDDPIPVISNLTAGTYKYTSTDGIYEFTVADDLRGIDTAKDMICFDRISHTGWVDVDINKKIFDGTEDWRVGGTTDTDKYYTFSVSDSISGADSIKSMCLTTHYLYGFIVNATTTQGVAIIWRNCRVRWCTIIESIGAVATSFKTWLTQQYSSGTPFILYYQKQNKTRIPLTFTKVASSTAPEVPMEFLTNTPSADYPAYNYSVIGKKAKSRNTDGSKTSECSLPPLRKANAIADTYNTKTGLYIQRVSADIDEAEDITDPQYILAEPIETILTPTPIETYYPETIIETDAESYCKPNLTATVKVMEVT